MGGQWMVDMVGGLAVVCREEGLSSRQAQHPSFLSWPLPLRPSPFSVGQCKLSPQPPFPGCSLTFKVFLPIASAWLLSSSGSSLLQDLLEPFYT